MRKPIRTWWDWVMAGTAAAVIVLAAGQIDIPVADTSVENAPVRHETSQERGHRRLDLIDRAQAAVKVQLKDPESATFRDVHVRVFSAAPVVCGLVNAWNSFGGYAGFERFMSIGAGGVTSIESQDSDFGVAWGQFCQ